MTRGRVEYTEKRTKKKKTEIKTETITYNVGMVGVRQEGARSFTIWTEYPNTFIELLQLAHEKHTALDLFPQTDTDLERVGTTRGKSAQYVNAPHIYPIRPVDGMHVKVMSGIRPEGRNSRPTPVYFNEVLGASKK
jgi:hypothetical protein